MNPTTLRASSAVASPVGSQGATCRGTLTPTSRPSRASSTSIRGIPVPQRDSCQSALVVGMSVRSIRETGPGARRAAVERTRGERGALADGGLRGVCPHRACGGACPVPAHAPARRAAFRPASAPQNASRATTGRGAPFVPSGSPPSPTSRTRGQSAARPIQCGSARDEVGRAKLRYAPAQPHAMPQRQQSPTPGGLIELGTASDRPSRRPR